MSNSLKFIYLKCWNLKKSKGKEKYKIGGNQQRLPSGKSTIGHQYPIIDNISISSNLMKHYVKDAIKIVILRSCYILKIQSLENMTKESPYIYIWNIMNYLLFLLLKWKLKINQTWLKQLRYT